MIRRSVLVLVSAVALLTILAPTASAAPILADHFAADGFEAIPATFFDDARDTLRIFYGHTSHGSQIVTGLSMLASENGLYASPPMDEYESDLGHLGDLSWMAPTRSYLDAHSECNFVAWSWCGGCSDNTEAGIQAYLDGMGQLEAEYPSVTFVYMTGHLDGTGADGNLYARNDQIRSWCASHDKVLFDFADIESYDPDGVWYPDESDACAWCADWCAVHECPNCSSCAHSHCFNCYRKGRAFWWLMARRLGWTDEVAVGGPAPGTEALFLEANRPNPFNPATTIRFEMPEEGEATVAVYDVAGRIVRTLVEGPISAGLHEIAWSGRDDAGAPAPSGVYFYRLDAGSTTMTRKMTLIR